MEKNTGKRRPKTSSPTRRESLVSNVKSKLDASVQRVRAILPSLKNTIPSLRDITILVALTVIAFASGFFVGRETQEPMLPGDFVSIQEIDTQDTSSLTARVPEDIVRQDTGAVRIPETEGAMRKEGESQDVPGKETIATQAFTGDTGVVGPVPAKAPEVKQETPRQETAAPTTGEKMILPVQGRIASGFGWRKHPVYQDWRYHTGIDIGAVEGTPVKAALSGKVVQSETARELGLYIVIEHPNGIRTKYAHLTSSSVKRGDQVKQGQIIGQAGTSGVTDGPYLHFEVVSGDKATDPEGFL